jgi:hypothetical protein
MLNMLASQKQRMIPKQVYSLYVKYASIAKPLYVICVVVERSTTDIIGD